MQSTQLAVSERLERRREAAGWKVNVWGLNESSGCGSAVENQGYWEGDPALGLPLLCSASVVIPGGSHDVVSGGWGGDECVYTADKSRL